jgi:hypothetical protein
MKGVDWVAFPRFGLPLSKKKNSGKKDFEYSILQSIVVKVCEFLTASVGDLQSFFSTGLTG